MLYEIGVVFIFKPRPAQTIKNEGERQKSLKVNEAIDNFISKFHEIYDEKMKVIDVKHQPKMIFELDDYLKVRGLSLVTVRHEGLVGKVAHCHICSLCNNIYEHEHTIKPMLIQQLYGDLCEICEKTVGRVIEVKEIIQKLEIEVKMESPEKRLSFFGCQDSSDLSLYKKHLEVAKSYLKYEGCRLVGPMAPIKKIREGNDVELITTRGSSFISEFKVLDISGDIRLESEEISDLLQLEQEYIDFCMRFNNLNGSQVFGFCIGKITNVLYVSDIVRVNKGPNVIIIGNGIKAEKFYRVCNSEISLLFPYENEVYSSDVTEDYEWLKDNEGKFLLEFIISLTNSVKDNLKIFVESLDSDPINERITEDLIQFCNKTQHNAIMNENLRGYERVDFDHCHYSKKLTLDFCGIVVKQFKDTLVFRHVDGYVAYVLKGSEKPLKEIGGLMYDMPFNHMVWMNLPQKVEIKEIVDVDELLKAIHGDYLLMETETTYNKLVAALSQVQFRSRKYYKLLSFLRTSHYMMTGEIPGCRAFLFSGMPGIGKSYDVFKIAGDSCNVYNHSYDVKTKQFFDGYHGQSIFTIDDIGHQSQDEWLIMLKLISDIKSKLPMAVANRKDLIPCLAEEVYLTTNKLETLLSLDKVTKDAVCRRMELFEYEQLESGETQVVHKLYSINLSRYVTIQEFSREEFVLFMKDYVTNGRQEPQFNMNINLFMKGINFLTEMLSYRLPELRIINKLLEKVQTNTATLSSCLWKGSQVVNFLVRGINIKHFNLLRKKDSLNARDMKYLKYEKSRCGLKNLTEEQKTWVNGALDLYSESDSLICVDRFLRKPTSSKIYGVDTSSIIDGVFEQLEVKVEQRAENGFINGCTYMFVKPNSVSDLLYETGKWVRTAVVPLNTNLYTLKDESDYRPTSLPTKIINKQKVIKTLMECRKVLTGSGNKSKKRRMERKRQAIRGSLVC